MLFEGQDIVVVGGDMGVGICEGVVCVVGVGCWCNYVVVGQFGLGFLVVDSDVL